MWDNAGGACNVAVPNFPPDVLSDGPRASQYTLARPIGEIGYCHVIAAARIVPLPFLGISVSDLRKFKCTTHKKNRECVVSHTLLECVGNATRLHQYYIPYGLVVMLE